MATRTIQISSVSSTAPTPSASSVTIEEFIPLSSVSAQERREHCQISEPLRATLGLTEVALHGHEVFGQVRVYRQSRAESAVFTVVDVDQGAGGDVIRFYVDAGNDIGGFTKLGGALDGSTCEVWALASEKVYDKVARTWESYLPPVSQGSSGHFKEQIWPPGNQEIALLVPHGENIELCTSNLISPFVRELGKCYQAAPTIWECLGAWGGGGAYDRWHVTSTEIDPRSFPGLTQLLNVTTLSMGKGKFRYAIALHGFAENINGVIIGGRATTAEKIAVRDHIAAAGVRAAYAIVEVGNDTPVKTGYPWSGISDQYILDRGGRDPGNIVNRLSLQGGIQLELSLSIRQNYAAEVAQGLASAVAELL